MLKLIIVIIFALFISSLEAEASQCFKIEDVKISELHPPIHAKESFKRRTKISIRIEINCETGNVIIPSTYKKALEMLDLALPFDYKTAAVSESLSTGIVDASVYRNSDYGVSVDIDLFHYFQDKWRLDEENNVCLEKKKKNGSEGCFWTLIENLIVNYQKGAGRREKISQGTGILKE